MASGEPAEMASQAIQKALHNHVILWELAHFLAYRDLKSLRKVCRTWDFNMRNPLFRSSIINICTGEDLRSFTEEIDSGDWNLPEVNLRIIPFHLQERSQMKPFVFNAFFDKYSRQIQKLKFHLNLNGNRQENLLEWLKLLEDLDYILELSLDITFCELLPINDIDLDLIPVLISLRKFNFELVCNLPGTHSEGWAMEDPIIAKFSQITAKMAREVSSVGFKEINFFRTSCFQVFQSGFVAALNSPDFGFPNLKEVRVTGNPGSITKLLKIPNPLTKLSIIWNRFIDPPTELTSRDWRSLAELLEKHSRTLEEFKFSYKPEVTDENGNPLTKLLKIGLRFPEMKALHLRLLPPTEALGVFRIDFQMPAVEYTTMFPKIQELTLDHGDFYRKVVNDVLLPWKMTTCHTLKKLATQEPRRNLKKGFPNAMIVSPPSAQSDFWKVY